MLWIPLIVVAALVTWWCIDGRGRRRILDDSDIQRMRDAGDRPGDFYRGAGATAESIPQH